MQKKLQVVAWSKICFDPILNFLKKNSYVMKNTSSEIINSKLVIFTTQILFAKSQSIGSSQIFITTGSDQHFFAFLKKITRSGSSANF